MFGLNRWKGLCENVCGHRSCWAKDKLDFALFNSVTNEMKSNVDVFSASMEAVVFGQCDGGHVVGMERERLDVDDGEEFG